ncbi:MAG: alkaline phosphatase family protein [Hydrotalea flava]|uniref:alkaline phosphatase family protein n=1 Tax=Hydrotalea TaxID=1004300 RepID=UPI0009465FCA|nr:MULTISPECIES: alkaline phosphatase family protein [Hydrotalea]MBY0348140.1 alkaline phosphatase family protein [Hydrotalea flava]
MKLCKISCLLLVVCSVHSVLFAQHQQHKVLFVIADGIPADVIESVPKPAINSVIQVGTYRRSFTGGIPNSYSQMPTISAPGYNNLLTGTWAYKHNVFTNGVKNPNYHYLNILRLIKESNPEKKVAIFSSWLDNRTKLLGDGLPAAGNFKPDIHFDGYELDTMQFPHDAAHHYMHLIDEAVVAKADSVVRSSGPDASWVYLEYTDDMGHMHGTGDIFKQAVSYLDIQMGKIWQAIQYREKHFNEKWLLILTTDHGRDAQTGRNHGGQSERERTTWMVMNTKQLNEYAKKDEPAVVDIFPTIARFMEVPVPTAMQYELDGVPMLGPISVAHPSVMLQNDSLVVHWQSFSANEPVKIYWTTTNCFKSGNVDTYHLAGNVPNKQQVFSIALQQLHGNFYKVVIEGIHNTVNTCYLPQSTKHTE